MFDFCKKNADISKIMGILVLRGIFSEITYVSVLSYQISSFYSNLHTLIRVKGTLMQI